MIRRCLALVAPLLQERIEPLPDQRTGAVPGFLGDQKDIGRAFHMQEIGLALRREALLFQLRARAKRRFQLAAIRCPGGGGGTLGV